MEKLDKKTYRGIVKFTLESMLNLSKTDKNYNLAADTIYYYENTIRQEKPEIWAIYNQQGGDRLALSQSGRGAFPYSLPCLLAEGKSRDVWR